MTDVPATPASAVVSVPPVRHSTERFLAVLPVVVVHQDPGVVFDQVHDAVSRVAPGLVTSQVGVGGLLCELELTLRGSDGVAVWAAQVDALVERVKAAVTPWSSQVSVLPTEVRYQLAC
jgi:hypothetical protein